MEISLIPNIRIVEVLVDDGYVGEVGWLEEWRCRWERGGWLRDRSGNQFLLLSGGRHDVFIIVLRST